ncbi:MAG TPA: hypothetical protein VM451_07030 [Candidatus Limnocylindria bacterium]|nr:hypothetical protein [Candidatus Limnocylindria bacterium]
MAHRVIAVLLATAGLLVLPFHPLTSFVLFVAMAAVLVNARGAFGQGMSPVLLAFISSLFLVLGGAALTLVGLIPAGLPCEPPDCRTGPGNFLLWPGLLLLGGGLGLFAWSVVWALRWRRQW